MADRDIGAGDASLAAGALYDRAYYETALGPVPYDRREPAWMEFFGTIADRIVAEIKPTRVLDVGCAKGLLVEALRDRGVEAYGIDVSGYALGEVRSDVRRYCRLASATEPFGERYDLIVCIEVLEHLGEDDGRRAIANMCQSAPDILFSSTPDDFAEPTHVNVRPQSWWIEEFARRGRHLDADFDARFVAPHALRLRSGLASTAVDALLARRHALLVQQDALAHQTGLERIAMAGRERAAAERAASLAARRDRLQSDLAAVQRGAEALRHELTARRIELAGLQNEAAGLRRDAIARDALLAELRALRESLEAALGAEAARATELDAQLHELHRAFAMQEEHVAGLERNNEDKDRLIAGLNYHLLALQRTIGWKVLERVRRTRDRILPTDSRRRDVYWRVRRPVEVLLDEGVRAFLWKTRYKVRLKWQGQEFLVKAPSTPVPPGRPDEQYQAWVEAHRLTPAAAARMQATQAAFTYTPVISIVTPVYETDETWLRKAIESVRAQIYPHWELCLVNDGSTKPHVRAVLDEYVASDPRVWVKHLPRNQGIASASTHGLGLATGDFVALLDHDDELPPETLHEVVRLLNEDPSVDLVYTDEDKLDIDGRRVEPFFKPDWSPDLLLSMNYITHLSVFRRSLLAEIGGFRLGLDGSQDYDLLLRFTERARRIAHIPKILYHWRKIPGSAAASPAAKPFAYEAGRQAIEDAVRRRGAEGSVHSVLPGLYASRYKISGTPLVSIIIPTRDRWSLLQQCLRSIEEKTQYPRYEIVVLDNDSTEAESLRGLNAIADTWRVLPYPGPFNFSAINNFGAAQARGEYFLFLNNDTQVVDPDWLGAMLEHAQRPEVGAVGARLHYPDGRIQHAGLVLGVGGVADHAFKGLPGDAFTYFAFANVVRNVSAVTAACMMVPRRAFEKVGGFDERLQVALNDVDLCLRLRAEGYLIVYTPYALLYHHESGTRGGIHPPGDEELVWRLWGDVIRRGDPYYNPNLTLSRTDWSLGS